MIVQKLFGPPGTGKTTALLNILDEELKAGVDPRRIAFFTFTVAARLEAVQRIEERFKYSRDDLPYFRTLHAMAFHQLGMSRNAMVSKKGLTQLGEHIGMEITGDGTGSASELDTYAFEPFGGRTGDRMLTLDHLRRHRGQSLEEALRSTTIDPFIATYFTKAYHQWKQQEGLSDFTDLLELVHSPLDVDVVFVDEAQDLSRLQWRVVDIFTAQAQRLYMAGDDDQAIFQWAGADPHEFVKRAGNPVVLAQSYRVPRSVHRLAGSITDLISSRQPKQWRPRDVEGKLEVETSLDAWEPEDHDTLVLYRNHYHAREIEERLRTLGFAYARQDSVAPGFQWARAIVFWERLSKGRRISVRDAAVAMDAILPGDGIDKSAVAKLKQVDGAADVSMADLVDRYGLTASGAWYDALTRISPADGQYLRAVLARSGSSGLLGDPKIRLRTIHASKGQQADHVVLLTASSRRVEDGFLEDPDDELRVQYVGVTRAMSQLTIVGLDHPLYYKFFVT